MSAPPDRSRRPQPLRERSQSQNNTLAIRIVPYSPPRLGPEGRTSSQSSAQPHAAEAASGSGNDGEQGSDAGSSSRTRRSGAGKEGYASSQGSALSSSDSPTILLAMPKDERVSGSKLATSAGSPTAPARASSSHVTNITSVNAPTSQPAHHSLQQQHHDDNSRPASPTSPTARPLSRRRNFIAVHSDKTFSLIPRGPSSDTHGSLRSPPLSFSTVRTSSSHERLSSDAFSDDRPSSPLTFSVTSATIPDSLSGLSPFTPTPGSSTTQLAEDPISTSPWNYRMVGGLRKVPKTPDLKQKKIAYSIASAQETPTPLAPLPETSSPTIVEATPSRSVIPKTSFGSDQTASTTSESTNYKVYGHSSPAEASYESLRLPGSSHSNVQLLGESSPAAPPFESSPFPPRTSDSDQNYILHGDPSPSSSLVTISRKPRPTYSQESLIVPPLKPAKRRSQERFGYYKSRSRESLRRAASIKSISFIISQEAAAPFLVAPAFFKFRGTSTPGSSSQQQDSWASTSAAQSSGSGTPSSALPQPRRVQMIEPHPHQWSSQLSTVISEDEGGSSRGGSRSVSMISGGPSGSGNRRSSTGWASSTHSRQMLSISSSLAQQLEDSRSHSRSHSTSDSLDRPQPAYTRGQGPPMRMVRDQDEHGDGLTDLRDISQQPSRSGLSGFFSSSNSSGRNLHSSGSSRANSFTSGSIPAWARLYYGSGERRYLGAHSISEFSDDSRPTSSFRDSSSPNTDHFPLNIHTSRRRAKEVQPRGSRPLSDSASMEISEMPPLGDFRLRPKKKTSSIWSPHLRMDRRASRYSIWEPPSVNWSAESGMLGRRNVQVLLFMMGFVFPFAWMLASVLPLPPNPQHGMLERDHGEFGVPEAFKRQIAQADEVRYQSAKWWRTLNRFMSVIGLLIIGAIVALVVLGIKQGWGQPGR